MREIKFRAWDKVDKQMFYGVEQAYDTLGTMQDGEGNKLSYLWTSFGEVLEEQKMGKLVLMQFTGLLDKNGKEIYEGDIIYYNQGLSKGGVNSLGEYELPRLLDGIRVVAWKDTGFDWDGSHSGLMFCKGGQDEYEVIGNIYENPELLKG